MSHGTASSPLERSPTNCSQFYGFGGVLEPRYIYGAGNLDQ